MNLELELQPADRQRKNFSKNNRGNRKTGDFYETPYSMTRQLLKKEWFSTGEIVLEPACGNFAISKILESEGYGVLKRDLSYGEDFLASAEKVPYIITNPPFSIAFEFVNKAQECCDVKFAFLLPLDYLHGLERFAGGTFEHLARIWVFVRRPMLGDPLRPDGKYRTGMQTYAWFVWDKSHRGPPQIGWIDNREFVLTAEELAEWTEIQPVLAAERARKKNVS